MSPREIRPAAALHACAVIAEQRLPAALRDRPAFVHEPHRGAVVFTGGDWGTQMPDLTPVPTPKVPSGRPSTGSRPDGSHRG